MITPEEEFELQNILKSEGARKIGKSELLKRKLEAKIIDEAPDYKKIIAEAEDIKSVIVLDFWSNNTVGKFEFLNGRLVYFDNLGNFYIGVEDITIHNPSLIIDDKKRAIDICELERLELKSDKAQWLIYQIEAKEQKPKRTPYVLRVESR